MNFSIYRKGFTLLELAIVLVIIALIVGGVLVGQDLVNASRVRSAVRQIDNFNSATMTFKDKYKALPGDIPNGPTFGFSFRWGGSPGLGNGDGILQQRYQAAGDSSVIQGDEFILFWNDLTRAQLISEGLDPTLTYVNWNCPSWALMPSYYPTPKIRTGTYIALYSKSNLNYYLIGNGNNGFINPAAAFTPVEAYNFDIKVDDASPQTGIVTTVQTGVWNVINPDVGGAAGCMNASNQYNRTSTYANQVLCAVSVKPPF